MSGFGARGQGESLAPDFQSCTFDFRKLSDLIRKTNQFEVRQAEGRSHQHSG
ncbi:MAG: hypothetical protein KK478_23325 [Ensifer alkalisoli]|nr:hypothetical protein [Sinorhizobium alkalisoli]